MTVFNLSKPRAGSQRPLDASGGAHAPDTGGTHRAQLRVPRTEAGVLTSLVAQEAELLRNAMVIGLRFSRCTICNSDYCISMFQKTGTGACIIPTRFLRISER